MNCTDSISLVAAIKNNLDYTKKFYTTTRELYPDVEICFVSHDSTDGTNEWLDSIATNDEKVHIFHTNDPTKCFADTYNKAAELATKPFVVFVHNDMILCSNFLENLVKHINTDTVVSYTTIEPPIFGYHKRPGKLIYDCGTDLYTFDSAKLKEYTDAALKEYKDQTEEGIVFFMCLSKDLFLDIGGFDNLFCPFFREDDDLIKRLKMYGIKYFTCLDAICYHFVSKTSRFSNQYKDISKNIEQNNTKNYLRKWGSIDQQYTYKLNLQLLNCSIETLSALEPIGQNIYISQHSDADNLIKRYIALEQPNTKIPLADKLHGTLDSDAAQNILCIIDCAKIDETDITNIFHIQNIIAEINQIGSYQINNIILHINNLKTIHQHKIKIKT